MNPCEGGLGGGTRGKNKWEKEIGQKGVGGEKKKLRLGWGKREICGWEENMADVLCKGGEAAIYQSTMIKGSTGKQKGQIIEDRWIKTIATQNPSVYREMLATFKHITLSMNKSHLCIYVHLNFSNGELLIF